ncbi:MAG: hypothetical protein ACE5FU_01385 [Nitrospinota bacterium]
MEFHLIDGKGKKSTPYGCFSRTTEGTVERCTILGGRMKELCKKGREEESLKQYRKLCKEKESFYRNNEKQILRAMEAEQKNEIRSKMPALLKSGHTVRCRNLSHPKVGHPCNSLACVHKDRKEDVVQGCVNCMKFEISKRAGLEYSC